MTVADALENVYTNISGVLENINTILAGKAIGRVNTFYDLPQRISEINGVDEIVDGTASVVTSTANSVSSYKFYNSDSLLRISMPLATSIGDNSFAGCSSLTEVILPSAKSVGHGAFTGSAISTVNMPDLVSAGGSVFYNCTSLTTVTLPSLQIVESGIFYDCSSLNKVDLTDVNSISANSFTGCVSLRALIIRRKGLCSLASVRAFDNSGISNGNGFIYVPEDYLGFYIGATNWAAFRNRIRPIEAYPDITGGVS